MSVDLHALALEFVERETELLDQRRFEAWLELFTDDGIYWLPIEEHSDPRDRVSLVYDDALRRQERVYRLVHSSPHAQDPPSRTLHMVSHVRIEDSQPGQVVVSCNQLIVEIRAGVGDHRQTYIGDQQLLAGRCHYHLRGIPGEWKIALKKLVLLHRDTAIGNLQFIA